MKTLAPTREPLLSRAVITAVVGLLVSLGLITADASDAFVTVLVVLAPLVTGLWSRKVVTPLADPQTNNGIPLVPAVVGESLPDLVNLDDEEPQQ